MTNGFEQAIGRRLESRGSRRSQGFPRDEPEPSWIDRAVEFSRRQEELEREWEGKRQAEAQVAATPQSAAGIIREAIAAQRRRYR